MPTYVDPKSGRTQQVQTREHVRISNLERIGWQLLVEVEPEPEPEPVAEKPKPRRRRKKATNEPVTE